MMRMYIAREFLAMYISGCKELTHRIFSKYLDSVVVTTKFSIDPVALASRRNLAYYRVVHGSHFWATFSSFSASFLDHFYCLAEKMKKLKMVTVNAQISATCYNRCPINRCISQGRALSSMKASTNKKKPGKFICWKAE